jgi:hypothetical protein
MKYVLFGLKSRLEVSICQPFLSRQGGRELQTVVEADFERPTLVSDTQQDEGRQANSRPPLEPNPSRRPLGRQAHDSIDTYGRQDAAAKRSVYAQEGDVEPSEFKQTVADLLKEDGA